MVEDIHLLQSHKTQVLPETSKRSRIECHERINNNNNSNNNNNVAYAGNFTSNDNGSGNSATLALDQQDYIGLGPSQAFYPKPITNVEAGFKSWF